MTIILELISKIIAIIKEPSQALKVVKYQRNQASKGYSILRELSYIEKVKTQNVILY